MGDKLSYFAYQRSKILSIMDTMQSKYRQIAAAPLHMFTLILQIIIGPTFSKDLIISTLKKSSLIYQPFTIVYFQDVLLLR